jgi:hypothetical protein
MSLKLQEDVALLFGNLFALLTCMYAKHVHAHKHARIHAHSSPASQEELVLFFGSHAVAWLPAACIQPYDDDKDKNTKRTYRKKEFKHACKEAEKVREGKMSALSMLSLLAEEANKVRLHVF